MKTPGMTIVRPCTRPSVIKRGEPRDSGDAEPPGCHRPRPRGDAHRLPPRRQSVTAASIDEHQQDQVADLRHDRPGIGNTDRP
jgi:hypothetical protein